MTHRPSHFFDPVPCAADGTELACYLDGPPAYWRHGCGCGWRGGRIITAGKPTLTLADAAWEAAEGEWERQHYAPAVLDEHEPEFAPDPVVDAAEPVGAAG